ncbi:MAG: glycosyltransferase family 2 protein [Alphaproteobacteria bacterium]|nr:glycosyltransferase family 2 protein [Alphaproteobacteria bacterium]
MTVAVVLCAHNEAHQIEACLDAARWADEIVVVADRCTDATVALARHYTDTIVEGAWPNQGARRHAGIDAAASDWILELDADERITPELGAEIRRLVDANAGFDYALIPFDNYVGKTLVRYGWGGSFGSSGVMRLFRKGAKQWGVARSHPGVTFTGKRGPDLKGRMIHYVDKDITDMIQRLNRYTTNRARDMREQGLQGSIPGDVRRLFTRFFKCYVQRKGYREGPYGLLIAIMAALFPLLSTLKARLETGEQGAVTGPGEMPPQG